MKQPFRKFTTLLMGVYIAFIFGATAFLPSPGASAKGAAAGSGTTATVSADDGATLPGETAPLLTVQFLDVGQGDAALISCDGHYMLIDGGPSEKSDKIYTVLQDRKIAKLDYIVATHPDADHIGGLSGAIHAVSEVGTVFSPLREDPSASKTWRKFTKTLQSAGLSLTVPEAGDTCALGPASLSILGPVSLPADPEDTNNSSIVIRLVYGETSFLFMGDAQQEEEETILASGVKLASTVLKVGHHGSDTSTGVDLLTAASPEYAVISVGKDNGYGHPTEQVLNELKDAGVQTYRTDLHADITCTSDGKTVTFETEKKPARASDVYRPGTVPDAETSAAAAGSSAEVQALDNTADPDAGVSTRTTSGGAEPEPRVDYILNTRTHVFHYPDCYSVERMSSKNKMAVTATRDEIIAEGYSPCGNCHP